MHKYIVLFAVLSAVAVSSIPVELKSITGWNELVYGEGIFEDDVNTIQGKSNVDDVILQELRDLLNQDDHMKSIYLKYTAIFKTPQNAGGAPQFRMTKLKEELLVIAAHNLEVKAGKHFWWMGLNQFSDLTQSELEMFVSPTSILSNSTRSQSPIKPAYKPLSTRNIIPEYINYAEQGKVSLAKNQAKCNSCSMFGAIAVLESADAIKNKRGRPLVLSEQELVDCVKPGWKCDKFANILDSFEYIKKNGVGMEAKYPYISGDGKTTGKCKASKDSVAARLTAFETKETATEDQMSTLLVDNGPLVVFFYATVDEILKYKGGVYPGDKECNGKGKNEGNHAVLLVGYGTTKNNYDDGDDYWLIKNSWGPGWGESGFFRLLKNGKNVCSVGAQVNWVTSA